MAFETKVMLRLLTESIGRAKSVKEAYNVVAKAASVEGMKVPSYDEFQAELKEEENE
jgi:hypothetical protein